MLSETESVACRILLAFDADPATVRNELIRRLPQASIRSHAQVIDREPKPAVASDWLDGLVRVLAPLDSEIRSQLQRTPDAGDLLIACACVPNTPAYQALHKLGIDSDQLRREIEQARADQDTHPQARAQRMRELGEAEALATQEHRLADAAQLRDQKRELADQPAAHRRAQLAALNPLRRCLGLAAPGEPEPKAH